MCDFQRIRFRADEVGCACCAASFARRLPPWWYHFIRSGKGKHRADNFALKEQMVETSGQPRRSLHAALEEVPTEVALGLS